MSIALLPMLVLLAGTTQAQPDISGTVILEEPDGLVGTCDQPCFRVEKSFEVFLDGNPSSPGICAAGENTYLYTLIHIGGAGPSVPALTRFEVSVAEIASFVGSAGFIPGTDVAPSTTTIDGPNDLVVWEFLAPSISAGQSSEPLFICATLPPGSVTDTSVVVGGESSLDAPGTCVGPAVTAGACCAGDGTCSSLSETGCGDGGGSYQGDGTSCDSTACPRPLGVPCAAGTECISGNCVDGVCCESDCADGEACNIPDQEGTCAQIPVRAPAASRTGLAIAVALLAALGIRALTRRRPLAR